MSSAAVVATARDASSQRLGFCQRCGDPISGKVRCSRCGGTSKEPRIASTQALPAAKKVDHWASRYVNVSSGLAAADELDMEYTHNQPPPLSPKRASFDPALGFGMPSRISRDLRSTAPKADAPLGAAHNSTRLSPALTDDAPRRTSQDYTAPVLKGSDGVLSKVCGSLVEPSESRNRWACADCAAVFARDSTLYAAPASLSSPDAAYYCRDCYARRYSLGACAACGRDVLGSTREDGKYVKSANGIWHGRCWKCSVCDKRTQDGVEVLVGMDGRPTCEGCFDRPRRAPSAEPPTAQRHTEALPDVRRLTRTANRNGAMGATIAELTKKLGQQTVASPRPAASRSSSSTSLLHSSSSKSSVDAPVSPATAQSIFGGANAVGMSRSGSLSGSPPKPRPLTAQFRDGLNLAAFQPSFGVDAERVHRRDSRSRSVSPVKRPSWRTVASTPPAGGADAEKPSCKVTSPALDSVPQTLSIGVESGRTTTSGFPRPLNSPLAERSEPLQGEKPSRGDALEPAEGSVRCAACGQLPLHRATEQVVMVTLPDEVHLHAECFRCAVCSDTIDGTKTFVRVDEGYAPLAPGLKAYAHPHCSPTVQLRVVQRGAETEAEGQRSYRASLDPNAGRSHATHQRELRPSPVPSPATSVRDKPIARPTVLPAVEGASEVRRFQPTAGAAPPTRSTILSTPRGAVNPAAGIFSRMSALSSASGNTLTLSTDRKLGGMQCCALCGTKLSSLESVLGPRGTQWHKACLVCRGVPPPAKDVWSYRSQPKTCGKKLDSGAKVNAHGEVRCRECFDRESAAFKIS
ncbi:hypothetical protein L1887_47767 [Cichorium endivia]|nr:hypothetical protein L1887_47767 [Cichorium endivia]